MKKKKKSLINEGLQRSLIPTKPSMALLKKKHLVYVRTVGQDTNVKCAVGAVYAQRWQKLGRYDSMEIRELITARDSAKRIFSNFHINTATVY